MRATYSPPTPGERGHERDLNRVGDDVVRGATARGAALDEGERVAFVTAAREMRAEEWWLTPPHNEFVDLKSAEAAGEIADAR